MECARRSPARTAVLAAMLLAAVLVSSAGCSADETASVAPAATVSSAGTAETQPADTPVPSTTAAGAASPEAAADFVVSGLLVEGDPGSVRPGDDVIVSARVLNRGNAPGTYEALLTVDGALSGRQLADLGAGQSAILHFSVPAGAAGDHDVQLGDARLLLRVLGPATFTLSALDVTPDPVNTGRPLEVRVTVDNTGGEAGTRTVRVRVDGKVRATRDVTVGGGEQEVVLFSIKAPAAGRHTVAVDELKTRIVVWKIARPTNGTRIVNKLGGGYGRLTVRNRGGDDAVVVLARSSAPRKALLAVYVRGGKTATVSGVRDGTYVVYYASGSRWDTYSRAFTADQAHRRFDSRMRFKTTRTATQIRYTSWTLALQVSSGGNAPTSPVGEGEFPGMR
jgi:hypothetical protein